MRRHARDRSLPWTLFLLASLLLPPASAGDQTEKGWIANLDQGFKEARKTEKPLLVLFRCPP